MAKIKVPESPTVNPRDLLNPKRKLTAKEKAIRSAVTKKKKK